MAIKKTKVRTRAQESSNAIEKLYISMRHLFNRGFYKPSGISGESLKNALLQLRPEIYGSIAENKLELNGLTYVIDRLPEGIEECQFINLTSDEGFDHSHFKPIIPAKRRRNCYRIDETQMNIDITRGRSDVYDILTHLTFLFIESHKIKDHILISKEGKTIREWNRLEEVVLHDEQLTTEQKEVVIAHLAAILGRTFSEVQKIEQEFYTKNNPNRFFQLIYWLGKQALNESLENKKRVITFSSDLRESIGHHTHGEEWASAIKSIMFTNNLLQRPIHIISANMHSVLNSIYAPIALNKELKTADSLAMFEELGKEENDALRKKVKNFAQKNGLTYIKDTSGTNINVQLIDTAKIKLKSTFYNFPKGIKDKDKPVIIVMDYAFGEQAFETMDELLKPYENEEGKHHLNVASVSVMGKAGILEGGKGDIMIPSAHIFEGTADNYPFKNELTKEDLKGFDLGVYEGAMITVLGTSLQNKDILRFFNKSTWHVVGLEMEGAHYQKAIQSASKIRGNISENVKVRYAYYASDNPLETGSTLASGGLGTSGVRPTYAITQKILEQIFQQE